MENPSIRPSSFAITIAITGAAGALTAAVGTAAVAAAAGDGTEEQCFSPGVSVSSLPASVR